MRAVGAAMGLCVGCVWAVVGCSGRVCGYDCVCIMDGREHNHDSQEMQFSSLTGYNRCPGSGG